VTSRLKLAGIALGILAVVAALAYVFLTPYQRIAGVRIGGVVTPAPTDWHSVNNNGIIQLKTGGFPPFVVNVVYSVTENGVITATRPDGGFWAKQARANPDGWIRIGDATYAMRATEILGEQRLPMLEAYGAKNNMSMEVPASGGVIQGVAEPLSTWEVFFWTPR
jgi:hypothetical protein